MPRPPLLALRHKDASTFFSNLFKQPAEEGWPLFFGGAVYLQDSMSDKQWVWFLRFFPLLFLPASFYFSSANILQIPPFWKAAEESSKPCLLQR